MKMTFILFFALILFSCDKDGNSTHTSTLTGKWKLVKYHNLTTGTSESEPTNISRSVIVEFSDNGHKGKISGHTVTNTVYGDYEILNDNKMKTLSFGGSKVWEPRWGSKFWDAIHAASSYKRQDNRLFIFFNAGNEKMEFEKQ